MPYVNPPTAEQASRTLAIDAKVSNSDSITLSRGVLEKLSEYRRETCSMSWEQAIERLLAEAKANAAIRENMIELVV